MEDAHAQGSSVTGLTPKARRDRVLIGEPACVHPAAHDGRSWNGEPEEVTPVHERRRRGIPTTNVVLRQRLLINVYDLHAIQLARRGLDAPQELGRVRAISKAQHLNLSHGTSRFCSVGRLARGEQRCRERQDWGDSSHRVIVEGGGLQGMQTR